MTQPDGFEDKEKFTLVCKLNKLVSLWPQAGTLSLE